MSDGNSSYIIKDPVSRKYTISAPKRKNRPFQEKKSDYHCPFCVGSEEVPKPLDDIISLPNKFAALQPDFDSSNSFTPARGICEVVLYTSDHTLSLADRDTVFYEAVIRHWINRSDLLLDKYDFLQYLFPFENSGKEIGVSIEHPHGQFYGLPFVPPEIENRQVSLLKGNCVLCGDHKNFIMIHQNKNWKLVVARHNQWPMQLKMISTAHVTSLQALEDPAIDDLAEMLALGSQIFYQRFNRDIPYILSTYQAPIGEDFHLHLEMISPQISESKIKYRAGLETALDVFINSIDMEEFAEFARDVIHD